jgi:peptide chain release factor 1
MEKKIRELLLRLEEVEALLGKEGAFGDKKSYKELAQEHSYLNEIKEEWQKVEELKRQLQDSQKLLKEEKDFAFSEIIREEIGSLEASIEEQKKKLSDLLIPPDPRDNRSVILEVRAGTGGDEAALFVGDCVRMYKSYAVRMGWKCELLSCTPSEMGGYKEYIMVVSGPNVYRFLQYEAGTHRVQRVPDTEAQGRVHTSAATVAVLLEPDEEEKIVIDEADLKIDTYRASGAGGQHVNVTDSAVRITHLPTGTVVSCQEERSQHKNKDKAMRLLSAKIAEEKRRQLEEERSVLRSTQVGTGDRSGRIRTYNFPQNRITDHRVELTLYKLDRVMEGELEEFSQALVAFFYQQKLEA